MIPTVCRKLWCLSSCKNFPQKSNSTGLTTTGVYNVLTSYKNSEKTNDLLLRKTLNGRTNKQMNGRTNTGEIIGPIW